jgi:hypothetical protein
MAEFGMRDWTLTGRDPIIDGLFRSNYPKNYQITGGHPHLFQNFLNSCFPGHFHTPYKLMLLSFLPQDYPNYSQCQFNLIIISMGCDESYIGGKVKNGVISMACPGQKKIM